MNAGSHEPALAAVRQELLGPLRQVGYVVADAEAAAVDWVQRFGVGPWHVIQNVGFDSCVYLGQSIEVNVSIASSYSNGIEIELIAPGDGAASMYSDQLTAHGPGLQHACFFPGNYDAARSFLVETGLAPLLDGAIAGTRFAYLHDVSGQVIEIADVSPEGIEARVGRAEAAANWDGHNPLRVF